VKPWAGSLWPRHCIELLEFVQLPRLGGVLQGREGGQRDQLVVRAGDVDLLQLISVQALRAFDLRNDFIAPALDAETVDIVTAEHSGKILSRLCQVHPLGADFVAVKHDFSLRLIKLQVGVGEDEKAAGECFLHQLIGELIELPRFRRRKNYELNREIPAARQRRRGQRNYPDPWNFRQRSDRFDQELLSSLLALAPRLGDHTSEPTARGGNLKDALVLRERVVNIVDSGSE